MFEVHEDSNLLHAAEKMLAVKCHRIWVVNKQQKVVGVVSITDVISVCAPSY